MYLHSPAAHFIYIYYSCYHTLELASTFSLFSHILESGVMIFDFILLVLFFFPQSTINAFHYLPCLLIVDVFCTNSIVKWSTHCVKLVCSWNILSWIAKQLPKELGKVARIMRGWRVDESLSAHLTVHLTGRTLLRRHDWAKRLG